MARTFDVPEFYRSRLVSTVKAARHAADPRKQDLAPSVLDFGPVRILLARHFGFCYGVENAIDIAYRAVEANPGRRVFLLSEMIHNPHVNDDLRGRGVRFLRSTAGEQLIPFDELTPDDVVIIPAFGASLDVLTALRERGVDVEAWDTTCPFVEKVWKRGTQIGRSDYTIVIHGKRYHEETRATFSRVREAGPSVVVRNMDEARVLADVVRGEVSDDRFFEVFRDRHSDGFDPQRDLARLGVVNQTTMLANDTRAIAAHLREAVVERYGEEAASGHFADTSDTLCYATNENQDATRALIETDAHLALVVGGFNSSNTSHLVDLCSEQLPTYFVGGPDDLLSADRIRHFDYHGKKLLETEGWWPAERPLTVLLTAGASCPDILLDRVIARMLTFVPDVRPPDEVLAPFDVTAA